MLNCKKMVPLSVTTPLPLNNSQNGWYVQCRDLEIQNAAATFKPSTKSNLEIANHVHQSMTLDQNNHRYPETHIPFIDEVDRKKKNDVSQVGWQNVCMPTRNNIEGIWLQFNFSTFSAIWWWCFWNDVSHWWNMVSPHNDLKTKPQSMQRQHPDLLWLKK